MRWFTCTPVAFGGGADFFARDSGLLCRGFQSLGIESRAVMPGDRQPGDQADLIRTDLGNLESAAWWRAQQLDGVVLYAWGSPQFRQVAAAIREAGVVLVLNQDSGGLVSPRAGFCNWLREQWMLGGQGRRARAWLRFLTLTLRGVSAGIILTDPRRAEHLQYGHVIACVSPKAAEHYRKWCRLTGGADLAARVHVIPHAVEPRFCYSSGPKRRQLVCVGRWQDVVQKRPWLLMAVMGALVGADGQVTVNIVGTVTPALERWHHALAAGQRERVVLRGRLGRDELADLLRESQIFYSPSAFESFGIAAAEALCSGCSVVAGRSVSMASFEWFVSENSGTLADGDTSPAHLAALQHELAAWERGGRHPERIAAAWQRQLHAQRVAARIIELAANAVC